MGFVVAPLVPVGLLLVLALAVNGYDAGIHAAAGLPQAMLWVAVVAYHSSPANTNFVWY
jgi:hypothetical protein